MSIPRHGFFFLAALLLLCGCGGIRFSQVAPEAKDFHPQSIALLSLDMGGREEVREALDQIITGELTDRKWFRSVLSAKIVNGLLRDNEALRKATSEYLAKLTAVNFSDGELSGKIGKLAGIDAFLFVNVDYWYYTKEADKNLAKVGLGMKMINAKTGALIWKAVHHLAPDYHFLKPELNAVARDVVKQMVGVMPH
ncbi:MAG TPA: hypothetical protein VI728_12035 [Syntrophales bacterium]|nr:hypothetical protein [Syntrophales bacterium]